MLKIIIQLILFFYLIISWQLYKQKYQTQKEMEQARSRMTYIYPPLIPPHGMVPPLPDPMQPMYPPGYR